MLQRQIVFRCVHTATDKHARMYTHTHTHARRNTKNHRNDNNDNINSKHIMPGTAIVCACVRERRKNEIESVTIATKCDHVLNVRRIFKKNICGLYLTVLQKQNTHTHGSAQLNTTLLNAFLPARKNSNKVNCKMPNARHKYIPEYPKKKRKKVNNRTKVT